MFFVQEMSLYNYIIRSTPCEVLVPLGDQSTLGNELQQEAGRIDATDGGCCRKLRRIRVAVIPSCHRQPGKTKT
jgi:hypothetical protein